MKTTLVLATTPTALAAGVSFGFYRFSVTGQPDVDTRTPSAEFELADGSYTGKLQSYDGNGNPLGDSFSQDFQVATPAPETWDAPTGLTVTFG